MNQLRTSILSGILFLFSTYHSTAQENILNLYYAGNYEKVIGRTTDYIASGDTAFNTFYLKALSEMQLGKTDHAISTLKDASQLFPEDTRVGRLLAGQYYEAGNYVSAWNGYTELVQTDSTDVASWLKLAEIASFKQQYEEAIPILELILVLDSVNLSSLLMLGEILNRLNNSGAIVYYEKAYEIYPENQKVAYAMGNWYIKAQMPGKVVPVCEKILEIDSTNIKFHKLLGFAYYKMGDPGPSILHFERAVLLGDSSAFTFKFMGISHYINVGFSRAIESLRAAVEKDSLDAEVHFFLGASLATTTQKTEAMTHLDKSLELMKPDPSVISRIYSEQGNIMRLEMEYDRAYDLYSRAWEADTTNPMAIYYMASILDNSLHLSKEALVDYQNFIDQLDHLPEPDSKNQQLPTIRGIVEDRIESLKEELFFLDQQ